jgi:transposase
MSKHKSEDYKITAVKYYLENNTNYTKTCEIFKCSERSLKRWINRYIEYEEIKRLNRIPISYKITKEQIKYAIQKLKENEQITMKELHKIIVINRDIKTKYILPE